MRDRVSRVIARLAPHVPRHGVQHPHLHRARELLPELVHHRHRDFPAERVADERVRVHLEMIQDAQDVLRRGRHVVRRVPPRRPLRIARPRGLPVASQVHEEELPRRERGREALREEARRDLLRLSIAIAERVLGRLPAHDPERVAEQAAAAIDMLAASTAIRLRVHPEDLELVKSHFSEVLGVADAVQAHDLVFETDETIVRGGCVAAAGDGEVDARLDVQMSRIVKGLFPELLETPSNEVDDADPDRTSATGEDGE